jgi:hypothetical protein
MHVAALCRVLFFPCFCSSEIKYPVAVQQQHPGEHRRRKTFAKNKRKREKRKRAREEKRLLAQGLSQACFQVYLYSQKPKFLAVLASCQGL